MFTMDDEFDPLDYLPGVAKSYDISVGGTGTAVEIHFATIPVSKKHALVVATTLGIAAESSARFESRQRAPEWLEAQIRRFAADGVLAPNHLPAVRRRARDVMLRPGP
jgi:hypothetical protein